MPTLEKVWGATIGAGFQWLGQLGLSQMQVRSTKYLYIPQVLASGRNSLRGNDPFIHPSRFYNIKLLKPIMCYVCSNIYIGINATVEAVSAE